MNKKAKYGLTDEQLDTIKRILAPFADKIEHIDIFGSRAQGAHRPNSDIDIVLRGSVDEKTIDRIRTLFNESNLPVKVDVLLYSLIKKPELKAHIDLVSQPLLTQKDLMKSKGGK